MTQNAGKQDKTLSSMIHSARPTPIVSEDYIHLKMLDSPAQGLMVVISSKHGVRPFVRPLQKQVA